MMRNIKIFFLFIFSLSCNIEGLRSKVSRDDSKVATGQNLSDSESEGESSTNGAGLSVVGDQESGCSEDDTDTDGDEICDTMDAFPDDPDEWSDFDNDGAGDNADTDDDGDGIVDTDDICPLSADSSCHDDDGDTVMSDLDVDSSDPMKCYDLDDDGCDDCSIAGKPDTENDGPDRDKNGICDIGDPESWTNNDRCTRLCEDIKSKGDCEDAYMELSSKKTNIENVLEYKRNIFTGEGWTHSHGYGTRRKCYKKYTNRCMKCGWNSTLKKCADLHDHIASRLQKSARYASFVAYGHVGPALDFANSEGKFLPTEAYFYAGEDTYFLDRLDDICSEEKNPEEPLPLKNVECSNNCDDINNKEKCEESYIPMSTDKKDISGIQFTRNMAGTSVYSTSNVNVKGYRRKTCGEMEGKIERCVKCKWDSQFNQCLHSKDYYAERNQDAEEFFNTGVVDNLETGFTNVREGISPATDAFSLPECQDYNIYLTTKCSATAAFTCDSSKKKKKKQACDDAKKESMENSQQQDVQTYRASGAAPDKYWLQSHVGAFISIDDENDPYYPGYCSSP
ncbi:MAG: hypothetical protein CMP11_06385 [Zetaproteobacteria bacterium]|nr:hypothetical protein [Pseudobdellovibrionaceae bacterium]